MSTSCLNVWILYLYMLYEYNYIIPFLLEQWIFLYYLSILIQKIQNPYLQNGFPQKNS